MQLDFLLSFKDESFKYCLSEGDIFGALPGLAGLLGVPFSLYLLILFELHFQKPLFFFFGFPLLMQVDYLISDLLRNIFSKMTCTLLNGCLACKLNCSENTSGLFVWFSNALFVCFLSFLKIQFLNNIHQQLASTQTALTSTYLLLIHNASHLWEPAIRHIHFL